MWEKFFPESNVYTVKPKKITIVEQAASNTMWPRPAASRIAQYMPMEMDSLTVKTNSMM